MLPDDHASFSAILDSIVKRSGLSRPDGRPLYAYRTTPAVLEALRELLQSRFSWTSNIDTPGAAAFCLFAAEWFCQKYDGGPWSWRTILRATGFRGTTQCLYDIVFRGLRYWNRSILLSGSEREFLVTLACEGGLPRGLLRDESGSRLQRFLRELLAAKEAYRRPAYALLPALSNILPKQLQHEIVFWMVAKIIDVVAELRARAGAAPDPIAHLDRVRPSWREEVPLRLDDEVAAQLLAGLLRAPRVREPDVLEVVTRLCLEGVPRVERLPRFPWTIRAGHLASQLGLAASDLPARTYLHLVTAQGARSPVATATLDGSGTEVDIAPIASRPVREAGAVLGRALLVASSSSGDIACIQPPGGEELGPLPWAFRSSPQDRGHQLLALGSCRTAAEDLLVALPAHGEMVLDTAGGSALEDVAVVEDLGRRVVRLRGRARWVGDGDVCAFRTGDSGEEDPPRFILHGPLRRLGFEGGEVWVGVPRWALLRNDGSTVDLGRSYAQEWRQARVGGDWRPLGADCCGDVVLRLCQGGDTMARAAVTVMPRGFEIRVRPSLKANRGRLEIHGLADGKIGLGCPPTVEWSVERSGPMLVIHLDSANKPPSSVELRIELAHACEARVRAPFPSKMRYFVGGDGELLSEGHLVALERLSSLRARAIVQDTSHGFVVEAPVNGEWTTLGRLRRVSDTCFELGLDALHEPISLLLASSTDLDETVKLRLMPEKGAIAPPHPTIEVGRYDASLTPRRGPEGTVELHLEAPSRRALGTVGVSVLRLEARPLEDPSAAPLELPSATDHWVFDPSIFTPGPWLVLGYQGTHLRLRPLLVTAHAVQASSADSAEESALAAAVRVSRDWERKPLLTQLAHAMAADRDHPDWRRLMRYVETLGHLPATTFDVIRVFAEVPDAAVAVLLQSSTSFESVWTAFEELPFSWAIVPVASWIRGMKVLKKFVEGKSSTWQQIGWTMPKALHETFTPIWKYALKQGLFIAPILEAAAMTLGGMPTSPQLLVAQTRTAEGRMALTRWRDINRAELLRRHASSDDWWPEGDVRAWAAAAGVPASMLDEVYVPADLPHREGVYNAPGLVAAISVTGVPCPLPLLLQLRRLRSFDESWFDFAHATALTILLGIRFGENKEAFDDV